MIVVDRRERGARWLDTLDFHPGGWAARLLSPLGAVYAAAAAWNSARRAADVLEPPPLSIAIGNLRVGGTGKTPIVHDLGRRLSAEGLRVAVLSRGYRAGSGGDEPEWLRRAGLDVHLGADRRVGFEAARRDGADVVLLDDGFQTRARAAVRLVLVLDRDLERAPRPLPAGPAREGADALRRADGILVRREDPHSRPVADTWRGRPRLGFRLEPRGWIAAPGETPVPLGPAPFVGPVVALSGLARPSSFEASLVASGVEVVGSWRERDHWQPTDAAIEAVCAWAKRLGAHALVCPEKNLDRILARSPSLPVRALVSSVRWDVDDPLQALGLRDRPRDALSRPG